MSRRNREKRERRRLGDTVPWKRPTRVPGAPGWVRVPGWRPPAEHKGFGGEAFVFQRTYLAISTHDIAEYPDGDGIGPQWHVSISWPNSGGRRVPDVVVRVLLADFGMETAEEDNHEPGRARHFWLPIDPAHRRACS